MIKLLSSKFSLQKENTLSITESLTNENTKSEVIFVLEIEGGSREKIFLKMKEIFQANFFNVDNELLFNFEECMKQVNEYLKDIEINISGIIAAYENNELHVSQTGKGEAYLIRKSKLNVIIENPKENDEHKHLGDAFTSIASGELLIDDRVVLSSLRVLRYATASQIVAVLAEGVSEGLIAIKDLLELETNNGAVYCLHARGESIFSQMSANPIKVPRHLRSSFFNQASQYFEKAIDFVSRKSGHNYEMVQNSIFAGLGIIFAGILIWIAASASIDNKEKEKYELYKTQLLKITDSIAEAETQALLAETDSSNSILDRATKMANEMLAAEVFTEEVKEKISLIQKQRDITNKITRFSDMSQRVLVDVAKVSADEPVQGMEVLNNNVYAYTNKSLFKTILDHTDPKINITETDKVVKATANDSNNSILFSLASGAMASFAGGTVSSVNTTDAAGFKPAVAMKGYNRFFYFLSPQDNQIWKYEQRREGFSAPIAWLTKPADLANALDLAIDGSVYVLKKDGGIALFHKGAEMPVSIKGGSSNALVTATKIFVKPEMKNVYFLNPNRNSVLIYEIDKASLNFKKEYVFETVTPLNGFFVDQNEQRLIISDAEKLYEITL